MRPTLTSRREPSVPGRRPKRAWMALGIGGSVLVIGGIASAATVVAGGSPKPAGPAVNAQLAACVSAHKAYCPDPGVAHQGSAPQHAAALAAPMTRDQAVASALKGANPAAKTASSAATADLTSLSAYEKGVYGGAHVNQSFDPSTAVWVVHVAAAPNPLDVDTPPGQKPEAFTHFTVVIDAANHQWIEETYEQ